MKINKFAIIFSMIIFITVLSFFFTTGCKLTGEIKKEEISSEEKSEITSISPAEVYDIITNDEDYIILDVRTQDEYHE